MCLCSPFRLWLAPSSGMRLGLVAAHYTERFSSCGQVLQTNSHVQSSDSGVASGAPSAEDVHDTLLS